ncbi:alpha-amylase family glycosyl hydrolase [Clostridium thermarum]|uniref:alpha-amylase family glycosyl hydrolase n=1 Tax=Clostridium thermarum TaxID=1716543 RepID=UPI0013D27720|nr:alpha-amylase family glycosyl hydrolase [Clostridium thermarum]
MKKGLLVFIIFMMSFMAGCGNQEKVNIIEDNYRNYYEIFVRSFYDSDGDGIGDLKGIVEKLDYLKDNDFKTKNDLGIDGIWLMPIMPSPTYHKYDVTDYYSIDPQYGTMEDFEQLIAKSKERGIKIIIDLVLNHTSAKHPWFLSAVKSLAIEPCGQDVCVHAELCREHNKYVNYYNFSQEKKSGYHSVGMPTGWYYEGVFWDQMPDLNLDNPEVRKEIENIGKFWIDKGVAGYRLDAVTSFYTGNISKNVEFLKFFNDKMKSYDSDIYIVGEAWSDANSIAEYYKSGVDSFFNFPLADTTGKIVAAVRSKNGAQLSKTVEEYQKKIKEINPKAIDAPFISNHDMGRSGGFLGGDLASEKIAAALYLMMPGNSFIYYGEEIGTLGSGKDENKRLPLLWSAADKTGITYAPPNADYKGTIEAGVMEQEKDENSLLQFYKKAIRIKNENPEIQRGVVTSIDLGNDALCAYSLEYEGSKLYIVHNLSVDQVELKLSSEEYSKLKLKESLTTDDEKIILKKGNLTMPARSTAILK